MTPDAAQKGFREGPEDEVEHQYAERFEYA
ncbi:hypothetical protein BANRA_05865 [Klebsiella variicola]|nr:hypothetical protein BANRA_05865 [Klebsiella variicola]